MFVTGSFSTADSAYSLKISGNIVYVATEAGIELVNVSNPASPQSIARIATDNPVYGLQVSGSTLLTAGSGSAYPYHQLQFLNFSDSSNPFVMGSFDTDSAAYNVQLVDTTAYLASGVAGLYLIDVSSFNGAYLNSVYYSNGDFVYDVQVVGNLAYLAVNSASGNASLQIVDVSNTSNPVEIARLNMDDAYDVQVVGTSAYVADGAAGLKIVDVSDSYNPRLLGSYNTDGTAYGVQVIGHTVYIADGNAGLTVLDSRNLSSPVFKGKYVLSSDARVVQVVATNAYVAATDSGLQVVSVSEFDNVINGGAGNDTLTGGAGADVLNGAEGIDSANYSTASGAVTASLSSPASNKGDAAGDSYSSIENLTGSAYADNLTGNSADNALIGLAGNDSLNGGAGSDTLTGGAGNDSYYVDNLKDVISETSTNSTEIDSVYASLSWTLGANLEKLTLTGTTAINGTGNSLANTLTGNSAANVLNGGAGSDTLTGGAGHDIFQLTTAGNSDKISDFSVIDDRIQLENSVFTKLTSTGALAAPQFKIASAATDNNDYLLYNSSTGVLSYDADGNGAAKAVTIALLGTHLLLSNADFIVI